MSSAFVSYSLLMSISTSIPSISFRSASSIDSWNLNLISSVSLVFPPSRLLPVVASG